MMNGNLIFFFWFLLLCIAALTCDASQGDHLTRLMNAKNVRNIDHQRGFHIQNEELAPALIAQEGPKATDKIQRLLGQLNNVNFTQYGGYVTVDEQAGRALFYYFAEVNGADPSSKPLVLWLNGDLEDIQWNDTPWSVMNLFSEFFAQGIRVWVYSGDHDGRVPTASTKYSLKLLALEVKSPWRSWYNTKREVGGHTEEYKGDLTLVRVRGAGHEVPSYQPARALTLIDFFLKGTPLPSMSTFN